MIPKIKSILYASDLSDNSIPALAWAMMLAHRHDARITFLHVVEEVSSHATHVIRSVMGEDEWQEMLADQQGEINRKVEGRVQAFCDQVKNEMSSCPFVVNDVVIARDIPVERILSEAESRDCDLIVMGTHGAGLLKDTMIGSTARRVLRRSKRPVFVIPLPEDTP